MPAVLVAAGIAMLSLMEQQHVPSVEINDKLAHLVMYAVLAVTLMSAFAVNRKRRWTWWLTTVVSCTAYGLLMEILQRFCTLTRSGETADLLADAAGAVIGTALVLLICKITNRQ